MKQRANALLALTCLCMLCTASSSAAHHPAPMTASVRAASQHLARVIRQPVPLSPADQALTLVLGAGLVALQLRRQHKTLTARRLSI